MGAIGMDPDAAWMQMIMDIAAAMRPPFDDQNFATSVM